MGIFKRNSTESISEFSRLQVRQVIIYPGQWGWGERAVIVHTEIAGKNTIRARLYDDPKWYTLEVSSRISGDEQMRKFRDDWKEAITAGLLPAKKILYTDNINAYGFVEVDFNKTQTEYNADFLFSLGRELDEKFRTGWYPSTDTDHILIFNYFVSAPLRVGYLGSYKFILKKLSDNFATNIDKFSIEYASRISAVIGFGYGKFESLLSGGKLSHNINDGWTMDELRYLPEFNGYRTPRLKTIQYMMRRGLRFLNYLERHCDALVAIRFKTHVLRAVDMNYHDTGHEEEFYLSRQQLTTRVIYGTNGLAVRDREARKVILGPRTDRHNLLITSNFVKSLSADHVQAYKNWIIALDANYPAVTNYALSLTQAIPEISFNWNVKTIATLSNTESIIAKREIWAAIEKNPNLVNSLPPKVLVEYLDTSTKDQIDLILKEIRSYVWPFQSAINMWISKHHGKKLNDNELYIATNLLQCAWNLMSNGGWNDSIRLRDNLLLQVASQSKLQPFGPWKDAFVYSTWPDDNFLAFYGIAPNHMYPKGLLDVIDIRDPEMMLFFARPIVNHVHWATPEQLTQFLNAFLESPKPGASELIWTILGKQLLNPEKQQVFLDYLNSKDSSGTVYLKAISTSIVLKDEKALLIYLVTLSEPSMETFWRRNKSEAEEILMAWKEFPRFYWSNLDSIPLKGIEKIRKFEGLQSKLFKVITPGSIARMNAAQVNEFVIMVNSNPTICSNVSLLRSMLIAPSAQINSIAAKYVKNENKFNQYWLLMLESNLPVSQEGALRYLESQVEAKDFSNKLLMALDSNNFGARKLALSILGKIKSTSKLSKIVDGLVENRNTDTWRVVSKNLELISEVEKYKEFTNQVFLSRRKARKVKEDIKVDVEELIEDISEAVELDTLIRMALSSVASDRDWALKQIALHPEKISDVTVETSWKGKLNV